MPADHSEGQSQPGGRRQELKFRQLQGLYAIVRLPSDASIPNWATRGDFTSITRSTEELSIVCPAAQVPTGENPGPRWICFRLEGPFAFSQTGVLLSFIEPLSDSGVPLFAISTYETDYVLVQEKFAGAALGSLQAVGHELWPRDESGRK